MQIVLFVLISLAVLLVFSGYFVFSTACRRRKELPWLDEEEISKTSYKKYYKYIKETEAWVQSKNAEHIYVTSDDGLKLHGLWIPADNAQGTVMLAHGYRSTWRVDFGLVLPLYHDLGYNLLIPDQRSHGGSEGKYITFGVKESQDMKRWIDFHNREKGEFPMLLSGLSMGASTMLYLANEELPGNVKGIIADCGFTSPWDIIKTVYLRVVHIPAEPSLFFADLFARLFAGYSLKEKDSRTTLAHSKLPVMLVHGLADDFVPADMTREAYAACSGSKRVLYVDKAGHGVSFLVNTERYLSEVKAFLKEIFQ